MEHTTGTVTVQALESKTGTAYKNPGDVVFEVAYADGYTGPRLMPEGRVTISRESAEDFEKRGIGHIVTEHTITEEDLAHNPGLDQEVTVGEVVELGPQLSAEEVAQLEEEAPAVEVKNDEEVTVKTTADGSQATESTTETTETQAPPASKKKGKQ